MLAPYEQYTDELRKRYGYLATWLPNVKLNLGDVGILKRDRFELITTLRDLHITFTIRDISEPADYEYVSADGATIQFESGVSASALDPVLGKSSAKAVVHFNRENAILFMAKGCKVSHIAQQDKLGAEILARFNNEKWVKDHVVITEIVTADSATILVSAKADAHVEFSGKSGLTPSGISLADVSAGVQIDNSSGVATQVLAARQLTPLFRVSGIRNRLLSGRSFVTRSGDKNRASILFSELNYEDVEEPTKH